MEDYFAQVDADQINAGALDNDDPLGKEDALENASALVNISPPAQKIKKLELERPIWQYFKVNRIR